MKKYQYYLEFATSVRKAAICIEGGNVRAAGTFLDHADHILKRKTRYDLTKNVQMIFKKKTLTAVPRRYSGKSLPLYAHKLHALYADVFTEAVKA